MADSRQKILRVERKEITHHHSEAFWKHHHHHRHHHLFHSLLASGRQESHHLHGQLKPLKVMLQVLSFHREAVLPGDSGAQSVSDGKSTSRVARKGSERVHVAATPAKCWWTRGRLGTALKLFLLFFAAEWREVRMCVKIPKSSPAVFKTKGTDKTS